MSKRAIPSIPKSAAEHGRLPFDLALKETLEQITGQRGEPVARLPTAATTAQIVAKINEIIDRLQ